MSEVGGAILAAGLEQFLVPVAVKAVKLARRRIASAERLKQYTQLLQWTRSSLQISTAFDWGHTCDVAIAIDKSARMVINYKKRDVCWSFTSRHHLSVAINRCIHRGLWENILYRMIFREKRKNRHDDVLSNLLRSIGHNDIFKADLMAQWILQEEAAFQEWKRFKRHVYRNRESMRASSRHRPTEPNDAFEQLIQPREWDKAQNIDLLRNELATAKVVVSLLEDAFCLWRNGCTMDRCCGSTTSKVARERACNGVRIKVCGKRRSPFSRSNWDEAKRLWVKFIDSWPKIVAKASECFDFPEISGIHDLVLHDMATGYVGSSEMLRKGGKHTKGNAPTIVHPGERAAVTTFEGTILRMEDSVLNKVGLKRKWASPAVEFARYALLRCDLVRRERMNFYEAVKDWNSVYASWDFAPAFLSKWAKDELFDFDADDYRLVLLRQALGYKSSIRILIANGTECTALGGFGHGVWNGKPGIFRDDKTIIIDRPLQLNFTDHKCIKNINCPILLDRWGGISKHQYEQNGEKYFVKTYETAGKPDIFRLKAEPKPQNLKMRKKRQKEDKMLFA